MHFILFSDIFIFLPYIVFLQVLGEGRTCKLFLQLERKGVKLINRENFEEYFDQKKFYLLINKGEKNMRESETRQKASRNGQRTIRRMEYTKYTYKK